MQCCILFVHSCVSTAETAFLGAVKVQQKASAGLVGVFYLSSGMDDFFAKSPLSGVSPEKLYGLPQEKRFNDKIRQAVEEIMRKATDNALMLGVNAYSPVLAKQGIEALRPYLTQEPTHEESLQLVRWAPTGEAIMFIGEPAWPEGEYANLGQIRVEVPYELVKDEDRPLLARSNGNYYQ